jgi:phosphoglycolate phosphatase-like HAD superfamily hydrolase
MNKIFDGFIFDIDGTLTSTNQLIFDSFNFIEPPKQGACSPLESRGAALEIISHAQQQEIKRVSLG